MSRKGSQTASKVAYMEEEDDKGNIRTTYAKSSASSPVKEKMNTSKKKSREIESPAPANTLTDSDSTIHSRGDAHEKASKDREKARPPASHYTTALPSRPAPKQSHTAPIIESATSHHRKSRDEASFYGQGPTITPGSSRPRAHTGGSRPHPNYPGSRPPVSNARYHNHNGMMPPPPQPQQQQRPPPMSFPARGAPIPPPGPGLYLPGPPPWQNPSLPGAFPMMPPPMQMQMGPMPPQAPVVPPSRPSAPPHAEYFPPQQRGRTPDLQRFDDRRPRSSRSRPAPAIDYGSPPEGYGPEERMGPRSSSARHRSRPPYERSRERSRPAQPRRTNSTRPASMYAPPLTEPLHSLPPAGRQAALDYGDEPYDEAEYMHHESNYRYAPPLTRRRPSSGVYDSRPLYSTEVAHTGRSRRNSSYYAPQSMSSGIEENVRRASLYQKARSGGMQLTAETLHAADRIGGPSSRSTRSSDSRDESEWRQSATTRTTRSSNEEDVTITVRGGAYLKLGDAEVQCRDGAEINFTSSRAQPIPRRITAGSDGSSYIDPDDRHGRFDRTALRSRAASQSGSYGAAAPQTAPPMMGYQYGAYDQAVPQYAPPQTWI